MLRRTFGVSCTDRLSQPTLADGALSFAILFSVRYPRPATRLPTIFWRSSNPDKPFERLKAPPGYGEPYHIIATELQYLGANQAKGTVIGLGISVRYVLPCYVRRMSRHNWRPSCPFGAYEILGM